MTMIKQQAIVMVASLLALKQVPYTTPDFENVTDKLWAKIDNGINQLIANEAIGLATMILQGILLEAIRTLVTSKKKKCLNRAEKVKTRACKALIELVSFAVDK